MNPDFRVTDLLLPENSDLKDFFEFYVDYYFNIIVREFRKVFPNHLYLGCRLYEKTHGNKIVRKIASKYCDVLSYNIYKFVDYPFRIHVKMEYLIF